MSEPEKLRVEQLQAARNAEVAFSLEYMRSKLPRFQFVLWWDLSCWSRPRFDRFTAGPLDRVYGWSAQVGPLEIRKWK